MYRKKKMGRGSAEAASSFYYLMLLVSLLAHRSYFFIHDFMIFSCRFFLLSYILTGIVVLIAF